MAAAKAAQNNGDNEGSLDIYNARYIRHSFTVTFFLNKIIYIVACLFNGVFSFFRNRAYQLYQLEAIVIV